MFVSVLLPIVRFVAFSDCSHHAKAAIVDEISWEILGNICEYTYEKSQK